MKEEALSVQQDAGDLEPFDLFQPSALSLSQPTPLPRSLSTSSCVTYASTLKRFKASAALAKESNNIKASMRKQAKAALLSSRNDYTVLSYNSTNTYINIYIISIYLFFW